LEKAIDGVRADFREKHKINPNSTVIFFAPGNEKNEAEFCFENVRKGVKEFILKYSSPTSLSPKAPPVENYTTVLSLQKGSESEKYVKEILNEREWFGRLIIVTNENNEHINAMAASDIGMVYDGQMASTAAACHLPVMVLIKMRMHHQWFSDLYNQWWNQMNIIADNNIHPELIGGEAWFGKICDTLAEWYVKPETRYDMIRKWEYFLKDAMSYKQIDRKEVKSRDIVLSDG
jgi:lipid A disaccharide synthetase